MTPEEEEAAIESGARVVAKLDRVKRRADLALAEARQAGPVDPETERLIIAQSFADEP